MDPITQLKIKLQSLGPLQPEAWDRILQFKQHKNIAIHKSFNRSTGGLAYIAEGLLKEYTAVDRDNAVIINFIGEQQFIATNGHNQINYLKATLPTQVLFWSFSAIIQLYAEFPELLPMYTQVCKTYAEGVAYRQRILEQTSAHLRIQLFSAKFAKERKYLKKKDIANYLALNYNHFLHINAHL